MKWRISIPFSMVLVSTFVLPSFAGSSQVQDSFSHRSIFNGESKTKLDVKEVYEGTREASSTALKREWGITSVTERKDGRTFVETDRYDATARSYSREEGDFVRTTDVSVRESFEFTGFNQSHRVTSQFEF